MSKNYKVLVAAIIVLIALLIGFKAFAAGTPSTNDINRTNEWAHVDQLSQGVGTTDLQFISTRAFWSCFEYRTDGDTSQVITENGGVNYNTDISDGLYPYYCERNGDETATIPANQYVEVRMVFGAEADERFGWTRFDVDPKPDVCSNIDDVQVETPDGYTNNEGVCEEVVVEVPLVDVPPVVVKSSKDDGKCDKPGKVGSFRYDVGTTNDGIVTLKWTKKSSVKNVDITVYASDKTTVFSKFRTEDDGKYVLPGLGSGSHWFKIRAINSCGFGDWSKKIDPVGV